MVRQMPAHKWRNEGSGDETALGIPACHRGTGRDGMLQQFGDAHGGAGNFRAYDGPNGGRHCSPDCGPDLGDC